jgi:hypothetical protein
MELHGSSTTELFSWARDARVQASREHLLARTSLESPKTRTECQGHENIPCQVSFKWADLHLLWLVQSQQQDGVVSRGHLVNLIGTTAVELVMTPLRSPLTSTISTTSSSCPLPLFWQQNYCHNQFSFYNNHYHCILYTLFCAPLVAFETEPTVKCHCRSVLWLHFATC